MTETRFAFEYPRRLRIASIGCGSHALRNVFPTFQYAPAELVAVCDLDAERATAAARLFGGATVYTDHRQMLERERPDAVFAVLNYDERGHPRYPAVAIDAMRAGAHVWIEKPPAASSDEIREMMAVSAETGRHVGVGFKKMFAPANVKAAEITGRPEFGAIHTISARYPQTLPAEAERGDAWKMLGFLDHMVHPYSVIRLLGGSIESLRVERHQASGATFTSLRFRSGAIGSLLLATGRAGAAPLERTEIVGDGGTVVVENNLRVTYYRAGPPPGPYGRTASYYAEDATAPLHWEPEFSLGQLYNKGMFLLGYVPEVLAFCESVLEGRAPQKGNLEDALEILRIYEAYRGMAF